MVRALCRMGNPILRQAAERVSHEKLLSDSFAQLLADMEESMSHYGGVGIAAPQVGVSLQVALIEVKGHNRYGEVIDFPLTTFINPKIDYLTQELQGFWEGCLSVPGLRGFVERPKKVRVTFLNRAGKEEVLIAENFLATVLQHELDHLNGTLYIDRIKDSTLLAFQEEYEDFILGKA